MKTEIKKTIQSLDRFLITTHINPEGDAIGSQLFICRMLKKMGKRCKMLNCDPVPPNLNFLPGADKIGLYRGGNVDIDKFDAFIILDCADAERLGALGRFVSSARKTINIDHHPSNSMFADLNWIDPSASSVGEMAYALMEHCGVKPDYGLSLLAYVAIVTDTGSFRHSNTTFVTHKTASALLKNGIKPDQVYSRLYENNSLSRLQITGIGFSNLKIEDSIIWSQIRPDDLKRTGAAEDELEGFIDMLKTVQNIKVAIVFQEQAGGIIKVSFRSKDKKIDVDKIASVFGGGGHKMASGCKIKGSLDTVKVKVLTEVKKNLKKD